MKRYLISVHSISLPRSLSACESLSTVAKSIAHTVSSASSSTFPPWKSPWLIPLPVVTFSDSAGAALHRCTKALRKAPTLVPSGRSATCSPAIAVLARHRLVLEQPVEHAPPDLLGVQEVERAHLRLAELQQVVADRVERTQHAVRRRVVADVLHQLRR
eukprot:4161625-Prymnesium_polylepis.1